MIVVFPFRPADSLASAGLAVKISAPQALGNILIQAQIMSVVVLGDRREQMTVFAVLAFYLPGAENAYYFGCELPAGIRENYG